MASSSSNGVAPFWFARDTGAGAGDVDEDIESGGCSGSGGGGGGGGAAFMRAYKASRLKESDDTASTTDDLAGRDDPFEADAAASHASSRASSHDSFRAATQDSKASMMQTLHPVFKAAPPGMMRTRDPRLAAMRAQMLRSVTFRFAAESYVMNVLREIAAAQGLTPAQQAARTSALSEHGLTPEHVTRDFADMLLSSQLSADANDMGSLSKPFSSAAAVAAADAADAASNNKHDADADCACDIEEGGMQDYGEPATNFETARARAPRLKGARIDQHTDMAIRTFVTRAFQRMRTVLMKDPAPAAMKETFVAYADDGMD